jgi:ABC-2 type transport system ATP-binding protein
MVGLDPKGARLIKRIFRERCQNGATIFVSTHTLEVAQEMCDRIGIILDGKLIALGTMEDLQKQSATERPELEPIFLKLTGGEGFRESDGVVA